MLRRLGSFAVAQLDLVNHVRRHPTGGAILFQRPQKLRLSANERLEQLAGFIGRRLPLAGGL
jgi:hypothetical protein